MRSPRNLAESQAAELCRRVWGVPAEARDISFVAGDGLRCCGSRDRVEVKGWQAVCLEDAALSIGGRLPIWWTPEIKALWLPLRLGQEGKAQGSLALHQLFLSAEKLSLQWHWPGTSKRNGSF